MLNVVPAKAGTHRSASKAVETWVPAFAGTTLRSHQMTDYTGFKEIGVSLDGMVATIEMRRPPHNFFDAALIAEIGEAFERLDDDPRCRTDRKSTRLNSSHR